MRTRLSRAQRRADILDKARSLIAARGLAGTEMEDIRTACGISRGGLYHHFAGKRAVLDALVDDEVVALAEALGNESAAPLPTLLLAGSTHLGAAPGVLAGLRSREERLDYLSALDQAFAARLSAPLGARLETDVRPGIDPRHVAELVVTVNAHVNRREILGDWTAKEAAGFAATALEALAPLLADPAQLDPVIATLREKAAAP